MHSLSKNLIDNYARFTLDYHSFFWLLFSFPPFTHTQTRTAIYTYGVSLVQVFLHLTCEPTNERTYVCVCRSQIYIYIYSLPNLVTTLCDFSLYCSTFTYTLGISPESNMEYCIVCLYFTQITHASDAVSVLL